MRPPIHSVKHIVQYPIDQIVTGTIQTISIISAVNVTAANLANEVTEGALVKAIYFELWLQNEGTLGESIVTVSKDTNFINGPTFSEHAALFTYTNKKNVFFTHQGLTSNDGVSGPVNIMRGWVKIPKSKQRMGLGDTVQLNISNVSANDLVRCGFALYKEYT